jgi:glycosyltransferase involved in cell wall biosynthesis
MATVTELEARLETLKAQRDSAIARVSYAVEHGITGLLVPSGEPGALEAEILRLFDDPPLRRRLVREASRRVRAEHARDVMARRIEAVYARLS